MWDVGKAGRVIRFFGAVLKLDGGSEDPKPFELQPWQAFIEGSLFGWVHKDTKFRRFVTAFIETGKGSGKSPSAAGTGLYMMIADDPIERRAEVYAAAVDKEQASILFRDAVSMTKLSPRLNESVIRSGGEGREFNIAFHKTGSFFRPISSESQGRGKSGYRPHCVLLDEVHEHPTNAMVEFMRAGTKGRKQALIFMITNSGVDRTSVCYEYHEYGARVAAGVVQDETFFSYICAVDQDDDPFTDPVDPALGYPKSWAKTNPSLGVTFGASYLEGQVAAAKGMPSKESIVRRLNFCQWVDASNPWIDGDLWRACEVEPGAWVEPVGESFLAFDLSSKRDLTAAAKVTRCEDGTLAVELRFWTPLDTLTERERLDRVPYQAWVNAGHLIAVPGRSIDYDFVVRDLEDWLKDAAGLAFDQWRIEDFRKALDRDSYIWDGEPGYGLKMVRHGQGFGGGGSETTLWMPRSITELESAVLTGKLKVKRNPCLTWNSASAVIETDATGNKKWEKRKSTGRIDGIVATCMAVGLAMTSEPAPEFQVFFVGGKR